jgi:hypothetical protein
MRKQLGYVLLIGGCLALASALMMDTTVRVSGSPEQTIGTTYGTETVAAVPDRYVHNIGLMQDQQNRLYLGGVLAVIGVLLVVTAKPADVQAAIAVQAATSRDQDEELRHFGVTQDGDAYVWGTQRFSSPEAALMFAKSRA